MKSGKLALQIGDLFLLLRYLLFLLRDLLFLLRYLLFLFRDLLAEFLIFLLKEITATGRFFAPRRPITRRAAGADMVARCSLTHALTMEQNSHHVQSFVGWGHLNCYMQGRPPARDLHHVRILFIAHHTIQHGFNLRERAEFTPVLPA